MYRHLIPGKKAPAQSQLLIRSLQNPVTTRRARKLSGGFFDSYQEDEELLYFDETLAKSLCSLLTKIPIPHLTGTEQINLAGIVECVAQVKGHRRSIDENGARYLLFFRQHALRREKPPPDMSYREVAWAFHSDSQDILVDLVNANAKNRMMWPQAKESGIFMWLRDSDTLVPFPPTFLILPPC